MLAKRREVMVVRRVLILLFIVGFALAAAACGSKSSTDGSGTPSGNGSATAGAMGGTVTVATTSGGELDVTVHESKRVEKVVSYGDELSPDAYGLRLTVRNTGEKVHKDTITDCVVLVDADGDKHTAEVYMFEPDGADMPDLLQTVKIPAGGEASGWVYFAMTSEQQPRELQFTADSGSGPATGTWSLE
jgi:hypothetical protein